MKKKIYITLLAIVMVGTIAFIVSKEDNTVLESKSAFKKTNSGMLSLLVETGMNTGKYTESTSNTWPDGYTLNKTLSKCENGGTLELDEVNKRVNVRTKSSDRCYVYFDYPLPDVTINPTNIPTTYGALANLSCSGATSTYSEQYQRIEISQINTRNVSCSLDYENRTNKTYLNNYIIGLTGTTQGKGQVVNENGYRYEGQNPNNYVWFNNELWRIIGVFDSSTHGITNANLVKIIKKTPIGGLGWDKENTNDWANSSLYKLLNPVSGDTSSGSYYNGKDGSNSGYCFGSGVQFNCDYSNTGIDENYREMIKSVTWKLGGHATASATAATFYTAERGSVTGNSNAYTKEVTGYIGLIYPSDYGYSVLASSCARTINIGSYSTAACAGQSWLYLHSNEWTLTPDVNYSNRAFQTTSSGIFQDNITFNVSGCSPVLYLDSSVYRINGNGTEANPYIIGM